MKLYTILILFTSSFLLTGCETSPPLPSPFCTGDERGPEDVYFKLHPCTPERKECD